MTDLYINPIGNFHLTEIKPEGSSYYHSLAELGGDYPLQCKMDGDTMIIKNKSDKEIRIPIK